RLASEEPREDRRLREWHGMLTPVDQAISPPRSRRSGANPDKGRSAAFSVETSHASEHSLAKVPARSAMRRACAKVGPGRANRTARSRVEGCSAWNSQRPLKEPRARRPQG